MSDKYTEQDRKYMTRALQLAKKGEGKVAPNPLVGAVLVHAGKIIGEGYHQRYSGAHAEINAIRAAQRQGHKIAGTTLYCTLEPCCHHGQTPPCADEIIKQKIKRVVIGLPKDPNPLVCGKSIKKLRQHNIKVSTGLMREEASELTYPYQKFIQTGLPLVMIKAGMSLDAKITHPRQKYISSQESLEYVHHLRHKYDAILVGINTVIKDDPRLNTRLKNKKPSQIIPIILDPSLKISPKAKVVRERTIVVVKNNLKSNKITKLEKQGVTVLRAKTKRGSFDLKTLLRDLGKRNITSILVEGGQKVITSFLNAQLVDRIDVSISPELYGSRQLSITGELAKITKLEKVKVDKLDDNILISGYVK